MRQGGLGMLLATIKTSSRPLRSIWYRQIANVHEAIRRLFGSSSLKLSAEQQVLLEKRRLDDLALDSRLWLIALIIGAAAVCLSPYKETSPDYWPTKAWIFGLGASMLPYVVLMQWVRRLAERPKLAEVRRLHILWCCWVHTSCSCLDVGIRNPSVCRKSARSRDLLLR
jgi:hypothetical protein